MRPAPVGQHCLECIREGQRSAPVARTAFGGRIGGRPGAVTTTLVTVNVLLFLAQLADRTLANRFALFPPAVADGEYYRLITAAFLHGGVLHIAFNMYVLYVVGTQLEAALGRARYVTLYFVAALGGSTLSYLLAPLNVAGVGASGAIFGLFGALLVIARRLSLDTSGIVTVVAINLAITFLLPNIDWRAHIGGLVTGAVLAAAYAYAPRRWRTAAAVAAPLVLVAVLGLVVLARTAAVADLLGLG
jgi:membrane associated rhomboid family serine protease